jgi:hypothetical protein
MKKRSKECLITSHFGSVYLGKQARRQKRDRKLSDKRRRRAR